MVDHLVANNTAIVQFFLRVISANVGYWIDDLLAKEGGKRL